MQKPVWKMRAVAVLALSAFLVVGTGCTARAQATDSPSTADDGTLPALSAIAGQGMTNIHAYSELEDLSDDIGGRVTGSPQCNTAIQWALATMKKIGLQNVHAEPWQLFRGWTRISAEANIISPAPHPLLVSAVGWTGSTPVGGVDADVVPVNVWQADKELAENSSNWRGKILFAVRKGAPPADGTLALIRFGAAFPKFRAAGALAVIGTSRAQGMHLTHTGVIGMGTYFDIPAVSIAAEDEMIIDRLLDSGKTVRVHVDVQNKVTDGPVDTANVVGEIPGTEHPEQVVVVGGHLDSWDLSEGATDDGMGVATTLGAAEAILKSGMKPRRTIRFVLFTGEEQGIFGSRAYVKTHQDEMKNHVAAVILDNGQGPVASLNMAGHDDSIPAAQSFASTLAAFGKITADDDVELYDDALPFTLAGLPGINLAQDSPDYRYTHHSAVDTFDKVDQAVLDRDATVQALVAFWIADRPERLAAPWPAGKSEQMLIQKHDDADVKAMNMWPFGDDGSQN